MASTKGSFIQTNLDEFPDPSAVPANLYDLFVTIYGAISSLAESIENNLGLGVVAKEDYFKNVEEDKRLFCVQDRLSSIVGVAGESISYGNLVVVRADGKIYKNGVVSGGLSVSYIVLMCGIAATAAEAGEDVTYFTRGVLGLETAQIGAVYYGIVLNGYSGNVTTTVPTRQVGVNEGSNAAFSECTIGKGLTTTALFYEGSRYEIGF